MTIAECYELISKLQVLSGQVSRIISELSSFNGDCNDLVNKLAKIYLVDDSPTPLYDRSVKLQGEVSKASSTLSSVVIPGINAKIKSLYALIERLEREAAEEEARRKAEAESSSKETK